MVRLANINDAQQLYELNKLFNGENTSSIENVNFSLLYNKNEVIIVDEKDNNLTGFICLQIKTSFCYEKSSAEITELYIKEEYRNKDIAKSLLHFTEKYCKEKLNINKVELITNKANIKAQSLYKKSGYAMQDHIHFIKKIN